MFKLKTKWNICAELLSLIITFMAWSVLFDRVSLCMHHCWNTFTAIHGGRQDGCVMDGRYTEGVIEAWHCNWKFWCSHGCLFLQIVWPRMTTRSHSTAKAPANLPSQPAWRPWRETTATPPLVGQGSRGARHLQRGIARGLLARLMARSVNE